MRSLPTLLLSSLGFCNLYRGVPARSIREPARSLATERVRPTGAPGATTGFTFMKQLSMLSWLTSASSIQ